MGVSNYPADFGNPIEIAPAEPTVLLGVPPLLLALLLVIGLILMFVGWMAGRHRSRETDTAPDLWKAIDAPLQTAMKANSDQLTGAARTLKTVIDDRLGPVLKLTDGLSGPLHQIAEALGEGHGDHGHGHDHDDGRHGHGHGGHGDDHGGHDHAPAHGDAPTPDVRNENTSAVTVIQTGTVVLTPPQTTPPKPPTKCPPTPAEQLATLRAAVVALNDHWGQKDQRLKEIRAARAALNR